jgi:hypothetical protein
VPSLEGFVRGLRAAISSLISCADGLAIQELRDARIVVVGRTIESIMLYSKFDQYNELGLFLFGKSCCYLPPEVLLGLTACGSRLLGVIGIGN